MRATKYSVLSSLFRCNCSNVTPAPRMKPSSALLGFPSASIPAATAGPLRSITRSACCDATLVIVRASRRGVAKGVQMLSSPASSCPRSSVNTSLAKTVERRSSALGGSSSVSSSINKVCFIILSPRSCTSGSQVPRASCNKPVPPAWTTFARGLCKQRVRSPK